MNRAGPGCRWHLRTLRARNRDQGRFRKRFVQESQFRIIESAVKCGYRGASHAAKIRQMKVVSMKMQDVEFVGSTEHVS
jgi:hypothetical protein